MLQRLETCIAAGGVDNVETLTPLSFFYDYFESRNRFACIYINRSFSVAKTFSFRVEKNRSCNFKKVLVHVNDFRDLWKFLK